MALQVVQQPAGLPTQSLQMATLPAPQALRVVQQPASVQRIGQVVQTPQQPTLSPVVAHTPANLPTLQTGIVNGVQERRGQLDQIIMQLAQQNAPKEVVQTIVTDYVSKFPEAFQTQQPAQQQPQSLGQKIGSGITAGLGQAWEAGLGALKSIPATINNASELGQRVLGAVTGMQAPRASLPQKLVTPSNQDQAAGFLGGQIGQAFAIPNAAIDSAAGQVANLANAGKYQPLVVGVAKAVAQAGTGALASKLGGSTDKQALTAGAISGGLSAAGSLFSAALQRSAENSYSKALGATTKGNKALSDKVVPGLIEQKQVALSRSSLYDKAVQNVDKADEQLTAAWSQLPKDTQSDWQSVLSKLQNEKDALKVNGVVLDAGKFNALHRVQSDLIAVAAGDSAVPAADARAARQIFDKAIRQSTQTFGITGAESDLIAAQKTASNAIRAQLAAEHPDIAILNSQFTFWKNVQDVVGATIQRTKSQGSLGQDIAGATGSVLEGGRGLAGILEGNIVGRLLVSAFKSTAWRTTSAVVKSNLADYLVSGNVAKATVLLQKLTNPTRAK